MKLIATASTSADNQTMTFSNIPQTYTDLYLVCSLAAVDRDFSPPNYFRLNLNESGSSYARITADYANTSGFQTSTQSTGNYSTFGITGWHSSTLAKTFFNPVTIHIPNYTSAQNKVAISDSAFAYENFGVSMHVVNLNMTSAITSIQVLPGQNFVPDSFKAGSTVHLYGMTAGLDGTTTVTVA